MVPFFNPRIVIGVLCFFSLPLHCCANKKIFAFFTPTQYILTATKVAREPSVSSIFEGKAKQQRRKLFRFGVLEFFARENAPVRIACVTQDQEEDQPLGAGFFFGIIYFTEATQDELLSVCSLFLCASSSGALRFSEFGSLTVFGVKVFLWPLSECWLACSVQFP